MWPGCVRQSGQWPSNCTIAEIPASEVGAEVVPVVAAVPIVVQAMPIGGAGYGTAVPAVAVTATAV